MRLSVLALIFVSVFALSAVADFQEIIPADDSESGGVETKGEPMAPAVKTPTLQELAAIEEERRVDAEALRKCAKNYDYSIKKRTLVLRLQQAKLKHDKVVSTTAELFARNPVMGKERRMDAQKELDGVNADLKKLEDGCTGRVSAPSAPGKEAPKDSAAEKK